MNRVPGKSDTWWDEHQEECGGTFTKISEPELTKEQVHKLSGLERAGRQKNKIDAWISKTESVVKAKRKLSGTPVDDVNSKRQRQAACPICSAQVALERINAHLDEIHPP